MCFGFAHHVSSSKLNVFATHFGRNPYATHQKILAELYWVTVCLLSLGCMAVLECSTMVEGIRMVEWGGNSTVILKS